MARVTLAPLESIGYFRFLKEWRPRAIQHANEIKDDSNEGQEDHAMRKSCWLMCAAALLATSTGCLIPMYSGDPVRRAQQLIYTSEDLRAITDEWERIWFLDQPSHMTPWRTHGGIL
jgi:hypothetical protein